MQPKLYSLDQHISSAKRKLITGVSFGYSSFFLVLAIIIANTSGSPHPLAIKFNYTLNILFMAIGLYSWKGGNINKAGYILAALLCLHYTILTYASGGLEGPVLILGIALPLLTYLIEGVRSSVCTTILIVSQFMYIAVVTLNEGHYGMPAPPAEIVTFRRIIFLIGTLFITTSSTWYFWRINTVMLNMIRNEATRDFLTGLVNRRGIDESIQDEYRRTCRNGGWFSVLMIDIDHFKSLNDKHGHQIGDLYLQHVAKFMESNMKRPADVCGRYGGEEFICLLPETGPEGAARVAENIRMDIANHACRISPTETISFTVSIGAASFISKNSIDTGDLVKYADQLMYQAKNLGRNRVVSHNFADQLLKAG